MHVAHPAIVLCVMYAFAIWLQFEFSVDWWRRKNQHWPERRAEEAQAEASLASRLSVDPNETDPNSSEALEKDSRSPDEHDRRLPLRHATSGVGQRGMLGRWHH